MKTSNNNLIRSIEFQSPVQVQWIIGFLKNRKLEGLEEVYDNWYWRNVGPYKVGLEINQQKVNLHIPVRLKEKGLEDALVAQARRLFDVDGFTEKANNHITQRADFGGKLVPAHGIIAPGVWDLFEGAVKIVLGQHIQLKQSIKLCNAILKKSEGQGWPPPEFFIGRKHDFLPVPKLRKDVLCNLSRWVAEKGVASLASTQQIKAMQIKGIGPWTKALFLSRLAGDRNTSFTGDAVVKSVFGLNGSKLESLAETWNPYKVYGAMQAWHHKTGNL